MQFDEDIARAELFHQTTEDESAWLLGEGLPQFYGWLKAAMTELDGQFEAFAEGSYRPGDDAWAGKARSFRSHVRATLARVEPLMQAHGRGSLYDAILLHRRRTLAAEMEPTLADADLWATVDSDDMVDADR